MATGVNIITGSLQATGQQVQVGQYVMPLSVEWTDEAGEVHEWSGTVEFPGDLSDIPMDEIQEFIKQFLIEVARKRLGV